MVNSTFRYEKRSDERSTFSSVRWSFGKYYKNAKKSSETRSRLTQDAGKDKGKGEEEVEHPCVIIDYENEEHAIAQIELSKGMKYALQVLHIDNINSSGTVIYPFFEKTMAQWLTELEQNKEKRSKIEYAEWVKTEVMRKIGEFWKLLQEMKEKRIQICGNWNDQGCNIPLISGVPRLLYLQEGDNLDNGYAKKVLTNKVIEDKPRDLPDKFQSALLFWKSELERKNITKFDYWLWSKHPVVYNHVDKKVFLLLINDIMCRYGLKGWLNGEKKDFNWMHFQGLINGAPNKNIFQQILRHKTGQSRGSNSTKGKLEEPIHYSTGSDIVRFTRNALMHFEENYKKVHNNITWHRGLDDRGREIVEILDDELDVCSLHYTIARTIIAKDTPPPEYTEEAWKELRKEKWKNLRPQRSEAEVKAGPEAEAEAAEVISQAYQLAQLKLWCMSGDWMEAKEIIRDYQPESLLTDRPNCWMEATEFLKVVKPPKLLTKKNSKLDWMKFEEIREAKANQRPKLLTKEDSKLDWMKFEEIEIKAKANQPLEVLMDWPSSWMKVKDIVKAPGPLKLLTEKDSKLNWMELKEIRKKAEANPQQPSLSKKKKKFSTTKTFDEGGFEAGLDEI